jgi:hypothetical protein
MVTLVWGWLSLLPVPLIAAGFCASGRPGHRGAQRPRSGAAGALDSAVRERIMPGGGGREPWWGGAGCGSAVQACGPFCAG